MKLTATVYAKNQQSFILTVSKKDLKALDTALMLSASDTNAYEALTKLFRLFEIKG